eukprot:TRINITY_DN5574_c0_g1_i13.p1 TRINITY_DN5574_c0_g1~~TRINITY_DN5574_c0_g1_i13.p1  ORF type:complete len:128 (+),score=7.09 TRINITY_DN5574_c0_g1_i13:276-659(+)
MFSARSKKQGKKRLKSQKLKLRKHLNAKVSEIVQSIDYKPLPLYFYTDPLVSEQANRLEEEKITRPKDSETPSLFSHNLVECERLFASFKEGLLSSSSAFQPADSPLFSANMRFMSNVGASIGYQTM